LGELNDKQVKNYRILIKAINEVGRGGLGKSYLNELSELDYESDIRFFDCLVAYLLWNHIGLDRCFPKKTTGKIKISTEQVACILTINRLLSPVSKVKTLEWVKGTFIDKILDISFEDYNKNKVYRELENIHHCKKEIERLFVGFSQSRNRGMRVYYFDGTTTWFEGVKCALSKKTIEKTRGFYPQVLGLMLITDIEGYPLAWEVVDGNKKDTTELRGLVKRISNDFGIHNVTYCFDRGIASKENFSLLNDDIRSGNKFISAINDNQIKDYLDLNSFQSIREKLNEEALKEVSIAKNKPEKPGQPLRRRIFEVGGFKQLGKQTFYKDLGVCSDGYRYIASYNYSIFIKEKKDRDERILAVIQRVSEKNIDLALAKKNRDFNATERDLLEIFKKFKVGKFFDYRLIPAHSSNKSDTYRIELSFKNEVIDASQRTDGLLIYVTNHREKGKRGNYLLPTVAIIDHYKVKIVIENAFRELKSFLDVRPIYLWKVDHVKAHFDVNLIAAFINNYIYRHLKDYGISLRSFYKHLNTHSNVVKISAGSGDVLKMKKISEEMKFCLDKLGILTAALQNQNSYIRTKASKSF